MKTVTLSLIHTLLWVCFTSSNSAPIVPDEVQNTSVNILVKRIAKRDVCTLGELYVNGKYFCKTLELRFDNAKKDSSSIPVGTYNAFLKYSTKKIVG